jgi:hypothetical protein
MWCSVNALVDKMLERVFVYAVARTDPTDRTLARDCGERVESPADKRALLRLVQSQKRRVIHPSMSDDLMAGGGHSLQSIGKYLGKAPVGVDRAFYAVTREHFHDAPDSGFATILAVRERSVVGSAAFAAAVLRSALEGFESDEKTDGDLCIIRPTYWRGSHGNPFAE